MLRKPRNARTDRLTNWRFFVQIYLVRSNVLFILTLDLSRSVTVYWVDDVALRYEHVVPLHEPARPSFPRGHFGI